MGKILIADDEQALLEVMTEILETAGYEVFSVVNGHQALELLGQDQFEIALIDVVMPGMDGYHLAQQIHGLSHPPGIIIMTTRDYENDKQVVDSVGVDAFLSKPFQKKDLIEAVERVKNKK